MALQTCIYCNTPVKDKPYLNSDEKSICAKCFIARARDKDMARDYIKNHPEEFEYGVVDQRQSQ